MLTLKKREICLVLYTAFCNFPKSDTYQTKTILHSFIDSLLHFIIFC